MKLLSNGYEVIAAETVEEARLVVRSLPWTDKDDGAVDGDGWMELPLDMTYMDDDRNPIATGHQLIANVTAPKHIFTVAQ